MGNYSYQQVKNIIFTNPNKELVKKAQDMRKLYSKHIHSIGFKDGLSRDAYVEDVPCFDSRKRSAISNRDVFKRILNEEDQVFTTAGGSMFFGLEKNKEEQMTMLLSDVINGMNLHQWVHTYALQAYRADPMGLIFMEADEVISFDGVNFTQPKCYPTYKSSQELFDYLPNGRNLEYVCLKLDKEQLAAYGVIEPQQVAMPLPGYSNDTSISGYFRFVDDSTDTVYRRAGDDLTVVAMRQQNPIKHIFKRTPCFIISDLFQCDDPNAFGSPLQFIIEIAECYANDRSVMELHKKLHGFPKAVEPLINCTTCSVSGVATGLYNGYACPDCTIPGHSQGTGFKLRTTPADVARFPLEMLKDIPRFKASDIFMYITPDIAGLTMMNQLIIYREMLMYCTYWGTKPKNDSDFNGKQDIPDTATKTMTDLQPKYARLNMTADWAENAMNSIANFIGRFWFRDSWKDSSSIRLSRNYILELPDDLLDVYHTMLKEGTPDVELDNQFKRYLMALYKATPDKLAAAIKFYELQPFPHKSDSDVQSDSNISVEDKVANSYFGEWMRTLNDLQKQNLRKEALQNMFIKFIADKIAKVQLEQQDLMAQEAGLNNTA